MNLPEEITKNAIVGTDKYSLKDYQHLQDIAHKIETQATDREEMFLLMSAIAFTYDDAGSDGMELTGTMPEPDDETTAEASDICTKHLTAALQSNEEILFRYIVTQFLRTGVRAAPQLLPSIIQKAYTNKADARRLLTICGSTGKWLCSLHPLWHELIKSSDELTVWETGNLAQRKERFAAMRAENPSTAREQLARVIQQENAQARSEFIELLAPELSLEDEEFLTLTVRDISTKVKKAAYELLKKLKGSALNRQYLHFASQVISVGTERVMLIAKKQVMHWNDTITPDESIFRSGVEKISSQKGVDDYSYWVAQVMAYVDPSELAANCKCTEKELLTLLLAHKHKALMFPYLVQSAIHFHNQEWAALLLESTNVLEPALLRLVPARRRKEFIMKFIRENFNHLLSFLIDESYQEMENDIVVQILTGLSANPYQINPTQYQLLALCLRFDAAHLLEKYVRNDNNSTQYLYFQKHCFEMLRIMQIKKDILTSIP